MKYVQPYGVSDPNAGYINGNPQTGQMGSIPPAAAFENPMREIVAVIEKSKLTPTDADLTQLIKGIRSQRSNYAEDTGSKNALVVSYDPPLASYTLGLPLRVRVLVSNDGPCTINAGPAGVAQIKKPNGQQLTTGDLIAGGMIDLVFDGTAFQMINFGGTTSGGGGAITLVNIPYAVDTSPTPNLITVSFTPALTAPVAGSIVLVKVANTNTGPTQMNVQATGNKPVFANGGGQLIYSDMQAGAVYFMRFDGTQWWIDPAPNIVGGVTFNVANNAALDALFVSLSRKRIASNATVTIQLGIGVFSRIDTYHVDADRIVLKGTMLAAAPSHSNFAKTGNSTSARAADSANNIAMLRSRYGTELHYTYAMAAGFVHHGPGRITVKDLLITGDNSIPAGQVGNTCISPDPGGSMYCENVSIWGSSGFAFGAHGATMTCWSCFTSSGQGQQFMASTGGSMAMHFCGSYGSDSMGCHALNAATVWLMEANDVQCHASHGLFAGSLSQITLSPGSDSINNGGFDAYASAESHIANIGGLWGTTSPAENTVGNYNSIITH